MAPYAASIAKAFGARVTILHVMNTGGDLSEFAPYQHHFATIREEVQGRLESYAPATFAGLTVDRIFKMGRPADEIVAYAAEQNAGLIIMPTQGQTRFRQLLLGSVTSGVLHDTPSSVLTAAHTEEAPPAAALPNSIVVAIDLSPFSADVLTMAAHFAEYCGASIRVVHALPPVMLGLAGGFVNLESTLAAEQAVARYAEFAAATGTTAPFSVIRGNTVADAVIEAEQQYGADLLVIGRGKIQGVLGRLRTGAHELIRRSHCPVLSV
jgi:nucleotide-binding universal stress UspA family protein